MESANNTEVKVEKYALGIIERIKAAMQYFRIVRVEKNQVYLEQFYTKTPFAMSIEDLVLNINNDSSNGEIALTNPSLLKGKLSDKEYKSLLSNNDEHIYVLVPRGSIEAGFVLQVASKENENAFRNRSRIQDILSDLSMNKTCVITNPMALKDYLIYYYKNFEKEHLFRYIVSNLVTTFSDYVLTCSEDIKNIEKDNFQFAIRETEDKSSKPTTIRIKRENNKILISGKRNTLKLEEEYFIGRLNKDYQKLNLLILKMHLDICMGLKLTPFRFYTSYNFMAECINKWNSVNNELYYAKLNRNSFTRKKEVIDGKELSSASVEIGFFLKPNISRSQSNTLFYKNTFKVVLSQNPGYVYQLMKKYDFSGVADEYTAYNNDRSKGVFNIATVSCANNDKMLKDKDKASVNDIHLFDGIFNQLASLLSNKCCDLIGVKDIVTRCILAENYVPIKGGFRYNYYKGGEKVGNVDLCSMEDNKFATIIYYMGGIIEDTYIFDLEIPKDASKSEIRNIIHKSYIAKAKFNLGYYAIS